MAIDRRRLLGGLSASVLVSRVAQAAIVTDAAGRHRWQPVPRRPSTVSVDNAVRRHSGEHHNPSNAQIRSSFKKQPGFATHSPPIADIGTQRRDVWFVPIPDILRHCEGMTYSITTSTRLGPRVRSALRDRVLLQPGHLGPWRRLLLPSRNRLSRVGLAEEEATDSEERRASWH
jgi:hypothetical protein